MEIVFGLIAVAGVFYLWLVGHWFGRLLAVFAFVGLGLAFSGPIAEAHPSQGVAALVVILIVAMSWFLACIPRVFYRVRALSRADETSRLRAMMLRQ